MRTSFLLPFLFMATAGAVTATYAGMAVTNEVSINFTTSSASGSVRDARDSADAWQFIGCRVTGSSTPSVSCQAYNAALETAACSSTQPGHVAAAQSINELSKITFSWSGGSCSSLGSNNYSYFLP